MSEKTAPTGEETTGNGVLETAAAAKQAAVPLATLSSAEKDAALEAIAGALLARSGDILEANRQDVEAALAAGKSESVLDRLRMDEAGLAGVAAAVRQVAALPDPIGETTHSAVLPNGLDMRRIRVPLGVIGFIYEGRPNATADAAALCLKSGNAVLLRGSSVARATDSALIAVIRGALAGTAVPVDAVQRVPGDSRASVRELMTARGLVDLLIPRGGADLIRTVAEGATVPVLETGIGNCHVYVDEDADPRMALSVLLNAKAQRPSTCNAAESLLVHAGIADTFLPDALAALREAGITVHGDARVAAYDRAVVPATEEDWGAEYLSLDLSAAVVDSVDDAVAHIRRYGSGHTESIITRSRAAAQRFTSLVDSAVVAVNVSTRYVDGGEMGLGAEVGISTQKVHARGPIALAELTTAKYVLTGDGHIRGATPAPPGLGCDALSGG
ncbi:glutamate-5-semialdehyde dehydrogenase [Streptomyces sp. LHD-70]|uniref:glutamate-5-semialdehyde dehydrogenase n=1 Tax=Streptomyces sp. LHD-70 TaxID=3072140 RepID=UPI0028107658|nr:glutamate-5-semialdehyde dehydrogenase [Streptomyces sp. LHD-70]MDQ8701733.1 glutamate-5-semialdehyde dehydrogenase [Streptomyces sp. LHD-70]